MKVGVLALQGDFAEHLQMLHRLEVDATPVRLPAQLEGLQGLIIPGGESTVIGRLLHEWKLGQPIREGIQQRSLGVWGSCAGAILLAKQVPNLEVKGLQVIDISIERNAFGRQVDSFAADLNTSLFKGASFPGIFIRAPVITQVGEAAEAVAWLKDGMVVAAEQGKVLATVFHPELTQDTRFHEYFLDAVILTNHRKP